MNGDWSKIAPFLTVAAFALAISYVSGYFAYIDKSLVSSLSTLDLLSISWRALPFAIAGAGLGLILRVVDPPPEKTYEQRVAELKTAPGWKRASMKIRSHAVMAGAFLPSFFLPAITDYVGPEKASIAFLAVLISGYCTSQIVFGYVPADRVQFLWPIGLTVTLIVTAYSFGLSFSSTVALRDNLDLIEFKGGRRSCANIAFAGERGVITFDRHHKAATLYRWDDIRFIRRGARCKALASPRQPKPVPHRSPISR